MPPKSEVGAALAPSRRGLRSREPCSRFTPDVAQEDVSQGPSQHADANLCAPPVGLMGAAPPLPSQNLLGVLLREVLELTAVRLRGWAARSV